MPHLLRLVIGGGVAVWLVTLPWLTAARVADFRSTERLWQAAIRVNPDMPRARLNYAEALWRTSGDAAAVTEQLQIARQLLPEARLAPHRKQHYWLLVNVELASLAMAAGRMEDAQRYVWAAAATDPRLVRFLLRQ